MEELYISLNKKRPNSLDEINVTNFEVQHVIIQISGQGPRILAMYPQEQQPNQFLYDFDIEMRGQFLLEFETNILINWPKVLTVFKGR